MACKRTYYGKDLQPSQLFNQLKARFGESRGEQLYLLSKKFNIQGDLNEQGEPSVQTVVDAVGSISPIAASKRSMIDVLNNLLSSRTSVKFHDDQNQHEYTVNDKKMESVSTFTDRHVLYTGPKTNFSYEEEGTKYHNVLQQVIEGEFTDEQIINDNNLTEVEKSIIPFLRTFTKRLSQEGKVIPELRVALADKGIAGSVDIVHIKKNGKVDIYDMKAVFESPGRKKRAKELWDIFETSGGIANYKAQRYSLQTSYYKYIMEHSDAATGRQGVEVENVYILPIEVLMDDNQVVEGIIPRKAENINTWKKGNVNFASQAETRVRSQIGEGKVTDVELKGYDTPSTLPSFVSHVIPKEPLTEQDLQRKARTYIENPNNVDGFKLRGVFYRWDGTSREAKLARIKQVLTQNEDTGGTQLTSAAVLTAEGAPGGYFATNKEASDQLRKILTEARAESAFALSTIEGFEEYSDILVLQRTDGSVDLVKMTYDESDRVINIANPMSNISPRKAITGETGSIVGNYLTLNHAKQKGITLQNNLGDRERLRMAIVAMEMKHRNPDMKVNRILVQSFAGKHVSIPLSVTLSSILPQVKAIYNMPEIKSMVSGRIKQILDNDDNYIASEYDVDPTQQYLDYIKANLETNPLEDSENEDKKNTRYFNMKALEFYVNGEIEKDQLIERLISNEGGMRDLISKKYGGSDTDIQRDVLRDPEYIQMSRTIIALMDGKIYPEQDVSEGFLGQVNKFLLSPTKTGRQTLDKAIDEMRKGIDTIKNEITKFTARKKPVLEALRDADPVWKSGLVIGGKSQLSTDTLLGMGQSVFEPLFQTKTTADGLKYKIPFLIAENSSEFQKLLPAQQRFITFFNDEVEKWFREAHPYKDAQGDNIHNWVRGMIPVLTASPNTSSYKAKSSLARGEVGDAAKTVKNAVTRSWSIMGNYGNFRSPDKANQRMQVYDFFLRQVNKADNTMTGGALESIGLDENMQLTDHNKNLLFETDLEEVMNQFMAHSVKKREMDKKLPLGRMYQSIFKYYEQAHFLKQTDSIKLLDNFINDNVFGEKIGADTQVAKVLNASIGLSSLMLLGMNWKVFTANGMQMGFSSLMHSMMQQFSGDSRFPGFKANNKAFKEIMKMGDPAEGFDHARKIDMLLEYYMPEDVTQLKTRRYKVTQKGLIDQQTAFAIDRIIERGLRAHYLIAQMIQDGTYDAHTLERYEGEDGLTRYRIKYDERKDTRFKNEPELKNALKQGLLDNGELAGEDDMSINDRPLNKAYDWRLRQKYKSYADQMFSSFDKDLKSEYSHYGLLAGFAQFRTWFRDKLVKATKRDYENMVTGDYVKTDQGFIWSNEEYKGIWWTLMDLGSIGQDVIKDKSFKNISKADKQNLLLASNSVAAWSLLALLIQQAFGDDDDPANVLAESVLMRGIQDLTSIITLAPLFNILADPFIFASYYMNLWRRGTRMSTSMLQGETDEALETAINTIPIVKDFV